MTAPSQTAEAYQIPVPQTLFPLVRHLSYRVTPLLAGTPMSANQATFLSLVLGLACNWTMMTGDYALAVFGGIMLVLCYILDNCDGEIARIKDQCSAFGMRFDSFVDWIVHASFFPALGIGVTATTGEEYWAWLGWIACAGSTVNYGVGLLMEYWDHKQGKRVDDPTGRAAAVDARLPETVLEWLTFAFRELTRADFCFIVLGLALFDVTWILLPFGAIGAQVYWASQFLRSARDFHV